MCAIVRSGGRCDIAVPEPPNLDRRRGVAYATEDRGTVRTAGLLFGYSSLWLPIPTRGNTVSIKPLTVVLQ